MFFRTADRCGGASDWISIPRMKTFPASGLISPIIIFRVTLFPVPLLPSRQNPWPAPTWNVTLSNTFRSPNALDTFSSRTAARSLFPKGPSFIPLPWKPELDTFHQNDLRQDYQER